VLLADPRVNPSAEDNFAIHWASQNGHIEVVKVLLADPRVNLSADDNYAINIASFLGYTDVVKVLLAADTCVNPSVNYNYALHLAIIKGQTEVVKMLLTDERVSAINDELCIARSHGHADIVNILNLHVKRHSSHCT